MAAKIHVKQIREPSGANSNGAVLTYNSTSTVWSHETTGAILVPTGTTEQRPSSPVAGMIRNNSDTNQLEAYEAGAWKSVIKNVIERFSFRVNFDAQQAITSVTNLPAGWSVVNGSISSSSFTLQHNVGRQPFDFTCLGLVTVSGTRYQTRGKSGVLEFEIDTVDTNKLFFGGFTTGITGTVANGHTIVWIYF